MALSIQGDEEDPAQLDPFRTIIEVHWTSKRGFALAFSVAPVDNIRVAFNGTITVAGITVARGDFTGSEADWFMNFECASLAAFVRDHWAENFPGVNVPKNVTFSVNATWSFINLLSPGSIVGFHAETTKEVKGEDPLVLSEKHDTPTQNEHVYFNTATVNLKTMAIT